MKNFRVSLDLLDGANPVTVSADTAGEAAELAAPFLCSVDRPVMVVLAVRDSLTGECAHVTTEVEPTYELGFDPSLSVGELLHAIRAVDDPRFDVGAATDGVAWACRP